MKSNAIAERCARGLKIHQSRSKCGQGVIHTRHTDLHSGETQENSGQEAHHSPRDLSVSASPQEHMRITSSAIPESPPKPVKERIKWPKISDAKDWSRLDKDLDKVLEDAQA